MSTATATVGGFIHTNNNNRKWRKPNPFPIICPPSPTSTTGSSSRSSMMIVASSSAPETSKFNKNQNKNDDDGDDDDGNEDNGGNVRQQEERGEESMIKRLEEVNPVGLGRRSRQIFDQVWRKFSGLGQISRTTRTDDDETRLLISEGGPMCEFTIPGAQNTTVLVVGATSRVGRIVVRKLMLRGYTVKALVRKADEEVVEMLPTSVEIVIGDVGEPSTLKAAVEGCNKIIYCATARSSVTGDLNRVDYQGVCNLTKAFQDYNNKLAQLRAGKSSKSKLLISKFKSRDSLNGWDVSQGTYFQDVVAAKYDGGMDASFQFTENGDALFSGYVFTRGGYVELSKKLSLPLGSTLDRYEGLILSVGGNGRSYVLILGAGPSADRTQSKMYFARISTKVGFCRVRVPFSSFRPVKPDDPPLDPFLVHSLTIRFEPRRQKPNEGPAGMQQDLRSFNLILEYIKAFPEEPGGQHALIFDQGNRISQGISCADVADICVKALHDSTARNKSFDVCYEYVAERGQELYELVAHLPDKANNYLTPALLVLEKNT
ncbi:protein HIGH CHLOROPHYLL FLUORESCENCE PHENOTYPE 173, chloroplastic isoform X2 [Cornus florida]|uniref:protein HIGH CHLOROPHYLL FLUORESCENCE PHENOTYPE 173, chloroplastic isoform X2 n=1 Tax=Cornus florida TaxID=4283 RepID=UPI0028A07F81|nr:protein HIGH CHLOROPHYLL FLUORESCENCE PHENOTYPE 173, chloroplastic isoform X2 [Cornus florida]